MLDKVYMRANGILRAGEHIAKSINIENLNKLDGASYSIIVKSTDNKNYEVPLPDESFSFPVDYAMIPKHGDLECVLCVVTASGNIVGKSPTFNFKVFPSLDKNEKALPVYELNNFYPNT